MKNLRRKTRLLCLLITILIINLGCAHHLPPLSKEVSTNLGTIGVCTSSRNAHLYFSTKPMTDWGEGCKIGEKIVVEGFFDFVTSDPQAILLLPIIILALFPTFLVAAPIGCIVGGLSTESESDVQEAEALLRNAFGELNIKEKLQYQFLRIAQEKTPYKFVVLGNIEFDDMKKKLIYSSIADRGVDTIVWINISRIGLSKGTSSINPSLRFSMSCNVDFIRATDGEVVYHHFWNRYGDDDEFVDWADNNAKPFRKEFNRCIKSVAEQMVEDLFFAKP